MDPISDMFIRIKNAYRAGHETVQLPYSQFKHELAKALERWGLVGEIERKGKRVRKILELTLVYKEGSPVMHSVKLLSKPSRRLYASWRELRPSRHGGVVILSTTRGLKSSTEAKKEKVGGELIAEVW